MHKQTMLQRNDRAALLRERSRRRDWNVFQSQLAVLQVEIGLSPPIVYRHLTATDIIGNKAEYYSAKSIVAEEISRPQKGLVYAITKNPSIDHFPSGELLQLCRPRFPIGHLVTESVGITNRENGLAFIPNSSVTVGPNSVLKDCDCRSRDVRLRARLWQPSKLSVIGNRMIGFKPISLREARIYMSPFTFIRPKSHLEDKERKDNTSDEQGDIDELPFHPPSLEFCMIVFQFRSFMRKSRPIFANPPTSAAQAPISSSAANRAHMQFINQARTCPCSRPVAQGLDLLCGQRNCRQPAVRCRFP